MLNSFGSPLSTVGMDGKNNNHTIYCPPKMRASASEGFSNLSEGIFFIAMNKQIYDNPTEPDWP